MACHCCSTAQGGLLSPLAVQWNVVPADNCSRRAALSTGCSVACRSNYTSAYFSFVYLFMLSNAVVIIITTFTGISFTLNTAVWHIKLHICVFHTNPVGSLPLAKNAQHSSSNLLTLGAHAPEGYGSWVCVSVT